MTILAPPELLPGSVDERGGDRAAEISALEEKLHRPSAPEPQPRINFDSSKRIVTSHEYVLTNVLALLEENAERRGQTEPTDVQLRALSLLAGRSEDDPITATDINLVRHENRNAKRAEQLPEPTLAIPIATADPDKISYFLQLLVTGAATGTRVQAYAGLHVQEHPGVVKTLKRLGLSVEQVFVGGKELVDVTNTPEYVRLGVQINAHKLIYIREPKLSNIASTPDLLERHVVLYNSPDQDNRQTLSEIQQAQTKVEKCERSLARLDNKIARLWENADLHVRSQLRQEYEVKRGRIATATLQRNELFRPLEETRRSVIANLEAQRHQLLLDEDTKVAAIVSQLSASPETHAILPLLPGYTQEGDQLIRKSLIDPSKNVDGINETAKFGPATPYGMIRLAEFIIGTTLDNVPESQIGVIGNGKLVGEPLRKMLEELGITPGVDIPNRADVENIAERKTLAGKRLSILFTMARLAAFLDPKGITPAQIHPNANEFCMIIDAGNAPMPGSQISYGNVMVSSLSADHNVWTTPLFWGVGPPTAFTIMDRTQATARQQHRLQEQLSGNRWVRIAHRLGGMAFGHWQNKRDAEILQHRQERSQMTARVLLRRELELAA